MTRFWLLIGCLVILFNSPVQSEIYKYRDSDGNLRFTDNFLDVPAEQRPQFEPSQPPEADNLAGPGNEEQDQPQPLETEPGNSDPEVISKDDQAAPEKFIKEFQQKQADLLKDYDLLSAERERIEELRVSRKTEEEISHFNAEAMALSEKIKDFNTRKKELDEQLKNYNTLIEKYNRGFEKENEASPEAQDN